MIKNLGLKITAAKAAKKLAIIRQSIPFAKSKKVAVLIDSPVENKQVISKFIKQLEDEGKEVDVVSFASEKEEYTLPGKHIKVIKKDVDLIGRIKNNSLLNFLNTEFDYLFSLNTSSVALFDSILAKTKAKCRVGVNNERNIKFCELLVQSKETESLSLIADRMIHYAKQIN